MRLIYGVALAVWIILLAVVTYSGLRNRPSLGGLKVSPDQKKITSKNLKKLIKAVSQIAGSLVLLLVLSTGIDDLSFRALSLMGADAEDASGLAIIPAVSGGLGLVKGWATLKSRPAEHTFRPRSVDQQTFNQLSRRQLRR